MNGYALISSGLVVNTVVWDGEGDIFSDYITVEIADDKPMNIGDAYINGTLYPKPRDGYDYDFDAVKLIWVITATSSALKTASEIAGRLETAQSEYERASDKITTLQQRIDDEDYSVTETESVVTGQKSTWVTYRKALRAYLVAADGSITLPASPAA